MSDAEAKALFSIVTAAGEEVGKTWVSQRFGWTLDESVPVCDWDGVDCLNIDGEDHVVEVNLTRTDIKSYLPTELGHLEYLQTIDLSNNQMYGTVPTTFQTLKNLQVVDLSTNRLTGSVPIFSYASDLERLLLKENEFDGSIPNGFFIDKHSMTELSLMGNAFVGTISEAIGQMSMLETLELSSNSFSGTIPISLAVLDNLKYLYFDNNFFVGTIPSDLVRKESNLKEVWLQGNLLSGSVPSAFGSMDLDDLYIDGNKFVGDLPSDLCQPTINADFFRDVYETDDGGDTVTTYTAAGETEIGKDYCQTIACPENTYSFEGVWPCQPCESGTTSPYLGTEEQCFPRGQEDILRDFYRNTDGSHWKTNNWFDGNDDICTFTGITCSDGHVSEINLKDMNLNGKLPASLGFLQHLHVLDVSDNHLSSFLPSDLRFAPLSKLDVSGNAFQGIVPPLLCLDGNINGNGHEGKFECDYIACSPGTYSSLGRATTDGSIQCQPCPEGTSTENILGLKQCGAITFNKKKNKQDMYGAFVSEDGWSSGGNGTSAPGARTFGIGLMVIVSLALMYFVVKAIYKRYMQTKEHHVLELDLASMRVPTAWSFANREVC